MSLHLLLVSTAAQSKPDGGVALLGADCNYERIGGRKKEKDGKQHIDGYGSWTLCTSVLSRDTVVYSVGIGGDLSFDIDMIRQYGVTVYAFHPTMTRPQFQVSTAIVNATVEELKRITFFPFGMGGSDDVVPFYRMKGRASMMSTVPGTNFEPNPYVRAPIVRLQTMLHMTGHRRVDVLKVDVEGTEYAIFDDNALGWLSSAPPTQIAIEYHATMFGLSSNRTAGGTNAVTNRLARCGYALRWKGTDDTFLYVRTRDVSHHECTSASGGRPNKHGSQGIQHHLSHAPPAALL